MPAAMPQSTHGHRANWNTKISQLTNFGRAGRRHPVRRSQNVMAINVALTRSAQARN